MDTTIAPEVRQSLDELETLMADTARTLARLVADMRELGERITGLQNEGLQAVES